MKNKKINIAELLKDCPSGMELDCTMYENVYFDKIVKENGFYNIECYTIYNDIKNSMCFSSFGTSSPLKNAKCVIFPKGKTTWEEFVPTCKFKDGENDIIKDDMEAITIDDFKANTKEWLIDKLHGMIISDAIKTIGNIHDELHKSQYPTTYKECCEVLMGKNDFQDYTLALTKLSTNKNEENSISPKPPHITLINNLYKLLVCRDAYWKIANWKPDWEDCRKHKYTIHVHCDDYVFWQDSSHYRWLSFPTKEIRDAFYENFKDLIEECKELL